MKLYTTILNVISYYILYIAEAMEQSEDEETNGGQETPSGSEDGEEDGLTPAGLSMAVLQGRLREELATTGDLSDPQGKKWVKRKNDFLNR